MIDDEKKDAVEVAEAVGWLTKSLGDKEKTWRPWLGIITCERKETSDSVYGEFEIMVAAEGITVTRVIPGSEMFKLRGDPDGFIRRIDRAITECSRELLLRWHARLP